MAKEWMVHCWGGAWNDDASPSIEKDLGIKSGYHYFKTEEEKDAFIKKLDPYKMIALQVKEGELTHKRTVANIVFVYNGMEYPVVYDFGYEYEEEMAKFMFYDGNYSCDCNRSLFIREQNKVSIPEMLCGEKIKIKDFNITYEE